MSDNEAEAEISDDDNDNEPLSPSPNNPTAKPSSTIGGASTTALSPAEEKEANKNAVLKFIKSIQPRKYKSKQKKHITEFAKWYFSKKPELDVPTIRYLLFGTEEKDEKNDKLMKKRKKGLLESCGNTNLKTINDIKQSSVLALELVYMLLDHEINKHADLFLEALTNAKLHHIQSMKLDRHILSENGNDRDALQLIFIFQDQLPQYNIHDYVQNQEAITAYDDWYKQAMENEDEEEGGADGQEKEVTSWSQVKLEDVDAEYTNAEGKKDGMDALQAAMASAAEEGESQKENEEKDPLGLEKVVNTIKENKTKWGKAIKRMNVWIKMKKSMKKYKNKQEKLGIQIDLSDSDDENKQNQHLIDTVVQTGSISIWQADFNPYLFLTSIHNNTSFENLKYGLDVLHQSVNNRNEQLKNLVKEYFTQYVYCKDTIDRIHLLLKPEIKNLEKTDKADKLAENGVRTGKLKGLMEKTETINGMARGVYNPILKRKEKSDKIKKTLDLLNRFKFLFDLPGNLKENIKNRQFDKVIRDYKKAKSLVVLNDKPEKGEKKEEKTEEKEGKTYNNDITKKIIAEINKIISDFRVSLLKKLDNNTNQQQENKDSASDSSQMNNIEEIKKTIHFLLELDCPIDPAWYYLKKQRNYILSLFEKKVDKYITAVGPSAVITKSMIKDEKNKLNINTSGASDLAAKIQAAEQELATRRSFNTDEGNSSETANSSLPSAEAALANVSGSNVFTPAELNHALEIKKLIKNLTTILQNTLPDFFVLAESVATGKFARKIKKPNSDALNKTEENKEEAEEKFEDADFFSDAVDDHKKIKKLIGDVIKQLAFYVRAAIIPDYNQITNNAAQAPLGGITPGAQGSRRPSVTGGLDEDKIKDIADKENKTEDPAQKGDGNAAGQVIGFRPLPPTMQENVYQIIKTYQKIKQINMLPARYIFDLKVLTEEIINWYVLQLYRNNYINVSYLFKQENWHISSDNNSITTLPIKFKKLMLAAVKQLKVLTVLKHKNNKNLIELLSAPFFENLKAFADTLHFLAFSVDKKADSNTGSDEKSEKSQKKAVENLTISSAANKQEDRKLLAILSNVMYTADEVLPPIFNYFKKNIINSNNNQDGRVLRALSDKFQDILQMMDALESILLNQYIRNKVFSLNHILKRGFFLDGVNWAGESQEKNGNADKRRTTKKDLSFVPIPNTVRSCQLELLLHLVFIHSEIFQIRRDELDRILVKLLLSVCSSFSDYILTLLSAYHRSFHPHYALLLLIEQDFIFRRVCSHFLSEDTEQLLESNEKLLMDYILPYYSEEDCKRIVKSGVDTAFNSTFIMFECFQKKKYVEDEKEDRKKKKNRRRKQRVRDEEEDGEAHEDESDSEEEEQIEEEEYDEEKTKEDDE